MQMPFISFLALLCCSFNTMLNRSGNLGHFSFALDLRARTFNLSLLNIMFVLGFSHITFVILRY